MTTLISNAVPLDASPGVVGCRANLGPVTAHQFPGCPLRTAPAVDSFRAVQNVMEAGSIAGAASSKRTAPRAAVLSEMVERVNGLTPARVLPRRVVLGWIALRANIAAPGAASNRHHVWQSTRNAAVPLTLVRGAVS